MTHTSRAGLRSIALFEAAKGVVALMAATGVMLHRQLRPIIIELAGHLHLNPASDRPLAILHALGARASMHLRLLALGVLIYAGIRLLEAAGLWRGMAWALWLGAVSAAIYLPFEIVEFAEHPRALPLALLVLNGGVAIYLTRNAIARS